MEFFFRDNYECAVRAHQYIDTPNTCKSVEKFFYFIMNEAIN